MKAWLNGMTLSVMFFCASAGVSAQSIMGLVVSKDSQGKDEPVPGANVYWLGTTQGTTTRSNGVFLISRTEASNRLIVSFVGMKSDTITVVDQTNIRVELMSNELLQEVVVEGRKASTSLDQSKGINTQVMTEKELFKAACCNLSESFETNPSVDVAFTDAITGTRQIQMLGLSGPNTMISIENMPGVRGLASSQGIQFIPGTWINSIEVTKGVGSVVNGYESIAGQINVELKKPEESERLFANLYLNQSGRSELNLNLTTMAGKKWATTLLLHGSTRPIMMDQNEDHFLDFPKGSQLNAINRWVYHSGTGWLVQLGVGFLTDGKLGGEVHYTPEDKFTTNSYGFEINTNRLNAWGKVGYQFPDKPYKSIGLQLAATKYDHESYFGFTAHDANEEYGYANLIYQSIIGTTNHTFKTGLSFMYNSVGETLANSNNIIWTDEGNGLTNVTSLNFNRTEYLPGAFAEYTYNYLDKFTLIAGARVDQHNLFGTIFTPRLHTRWSIAPLTTLRFSAGKGTRVANVITENTSVLATSRNLIFSGQQSNYAYGYRPDEAWNMGMNLSRDFTIDYRPGSVSLDYYYTDFVNQVVLDLDKSTREANFTRLNGQSYSHSLQLQVDYELIRRLDLRLSYRFLNVQTTYFDGLLQRQLIARDRAFVNLAYETRNKWKFDVTVQWIGQQRIPNTRENPEQYQLSSTSPDYVLINTQVTKDFNSRWSVYLGIENVTNYMLDNPIVAADQPFSSYFDSSLVWGPIFGRMVYSGVRWRVPHKE